MPRSATAAFARPAACLIFAAALVLGGPAPAAAQGATWAVATEADLRTALGAAVAGDTILFSANITLAATLPQIARNITIDGGGFALSGNDQFRGFVVTGTNVAVRNLTIQNTLITGGAGGNGAAGGGGGAGLGGALYVAQGATVTVTDVQLLANRAVGGAGGTGNVGINGGAGGGASGGAGGSGTPGFVHNGSPAGTFGGGGGAASWPQTGGASGGGGGEYGGGGGSTNATTAVSRVGGGAGATGLAGAGGGGGAGAGGAVFVQWGGTLVIAGAFTVDGNSAVGGAAGTGATPGSGLGAGLFLDPRGTLGPGTLSISTNSTVTINDPIADRRGSGGTGGAFSASYVVSKTGTGTLVLGGDNTYTGGTTLGAGVLSISRDANLGATTGRLTAGNGTTLRITGADSQIFGRNFVVTGGTATVDVAPGKTATWTGQVTDQLPAALQLTGGGVFALTNTGNSYRGGTTVTGGTTLTVGADGALGAPAGGVTLGDALTGGVLAISSSGFVSSRALAFGGAGATIDTGGFDVTLAGVAGGAGGFTKIGLGTLTFGNAGNTYSGGTIVNAGTLRAGAANVFGANPSLTIGSSAAVDFNVFGQSLNTLSGSGSLALTGAASTLTIGATNASSTFTGAISGAGSLFKVGSGTLTLGGSNTFSGGVALQGGTLQVSQDANLGGAGATVAMSDATTLDLTSGGAYGRALAIAGTATVNTAAGQSATWSGQIADNGTAGTLRLTGGGTFVLANAGNTYSGGTIVNAGTLRAGAANVFGANPSLTIGSSGTVDFDVFGQSLNTLSGSGSLALTGAASSLTIGATNASSTFTGAISGAGSLFKVGSGTLTLGGSNTFSGGTDVSGGTLRAGAANVFGGNPSLTIGSSSAVDFDVFAQSLDTLSGSGSLALSGAASSLTIGATNASSTFTGAISGAGSLFKVGSGTLTLGGSNTFSGGIALQGGTLQVSQDANLGAAGATVAMSDATTLDLTSGGAYGRALAIAGTATVNTAAGQSATWSGQIADNGSAGTLRLTGGGTFVLANTANSYSGGTVVDGGSTLNVGADAVLGAAGSNVTLGDATTTGTLGLVSSGMLLSRPITLGAAGATINTSSGSIATVSGAIGGTGGLTKGGAGTLILSGANTFAGGLTLQSGMLRMTSGNALSSTSALALGGGTTLDLAGGVYAQDLSIAGVASLTAGAGQSVTWGGAIGGAGMLSVAGGGTIALTSTANSYSGGTLVTGGTSLIANADSVLGAAGSRLTLGNATTSGTLGISTPAQPGVTFSRPITLGSAGGAVDAALSSTATITGTISGPGGLTKLGPGTLALAGLHTFTGLTHVHEGSLFVDAGLPGSVLVDQGATLRAGGIVGGSLTVGGLLLVPAPSLQTATFNRTFFGANSRSGVRTAAEVPSLVIDGDLTTNPGSTFRFWLSPDIAAPVIVNGAATLNDTHVVVDVNDPNPKRVATYLGIAAAGGLKMTGGDVSSPSPLLVPVLNRQANALTVTVVNLGVPLPVAVPAAFNPRGATGDFKRVMTELWALDDANLRPALRSLSGEIHASEQRMAVLDSLAMTDMIRSEIDTQEAIAEERPATGAASLRPWFGAGADHVSFDGGTANTGGSAGGFDFKPATAWALGGGGALSVGDLSLSGVSGSSQATSPRAFFYSGLSFGPFSVHWGGSRAWTTTSATRDIEFVAYVPDASGRPVPLFPGAFAGSGDRPGEGGIESGLVRPGVNRRATALQRSTASDAWSEWQFARKFDTWKVDTKLGLRVARFSRAAFSETGADSISLDGLDQTLKSNQTNFDFHLFRQTGSWRPNILVTYRREFGDDFTSANVSFAGNRESPFAVRGFAMPKNVFQGLFAITMRSLAGLLYTLEYQTLQSSEESRHSLRFKVRLW